MLEEDVSTWQLVGAALKALGSTRDERAVEAILPFLEMDSWAQTVATRALGGLAATREESVLETLPLDAVEVFNAATTLDRHNRQARAYAKKRGVGMLASNDAHHASMIGTAHTLVEAEELTLSSVIKQIPKSYLTVERYQGFRACLQKTFANVRRLARRPK